MCGLCTEGTDPGVGVITDCCGKLMLRPLLLLLEEAGVG